MLLLCSVLLACLAGSAESATFFYGASRVDSGATSSSTAVVQSTQKDTSDPHLLLTVADSALRPDGGEGVDEAEGRGSSETADNGLNRDDLRDVYNFCIYLPVLEKAGRVRKSRQSREICGKLVEMLQPMFKRRRHIDTRRMELEEAVEAAKRAAWL